jgi:hypothetical protein
MARGLQSGLVLNFVPRIAVEHRFGRTVALCAALALTSAATSAAQNGQLYLANYKSDVDALEKLTAESATKQADAVPDSKPIAIRCTESVEKAHAYSSIARVLNGSMKDLATRDYVEISWALDYVRPDRYHVIQYMWSGGPGYDYDEWLTIGSSHLDFVVGMWVKGLKGVSAPRIELNRSLGTEKYLQVMRTEQPGSAGIYLYRGRRYYMLAYELSISGDFKAFFLHESGAAKLLVWIDSETGMLAKTQFTPAANPSGGAPRQFEQVFAGYSADIHIDAPRQVLNSK